MYPSQRFPRHVRLLTPSEFKEVYEQPQRIYHAFVIVHLKENKLGHARLGVTILRRHLRKAVDRNRLRRMIREGFRMHFSQLGPFDIVIRVKREAASCDQDKLFQHLWPLWQRVISFQGKSQGSLSMHTATR